jgi:hypothetical protein
MMQKAFKLDKRDNNNLISQIEILDSLYNHQQLLD